MNIPQNLSQLINFQSGSVVSKEILNKPTGTITLFAFDQDQGLSEHSTPFTAFVSILEGVAEIKIADKVHTVNLGESIILPSNTPHSLKAIKPFKMLLTMIKS